MILANKEVTYHKAPTAPAKTTAPYDTASLAIRDEEDAPITKPLTKVLKPPTPELLPEENPKKAPTAPVLTQKGTQSFEPLAPKKVSSEADLTESLLEGTSKLKKGKFINPTAASSEAIKAKIIHVYQNKIDRITTQIKALQSREMNSVQPVFDLDDNPTQSLPLTEPAQSSISMLLRERKFLEKQLQTLQTTTLRSSKNNPQPFFIYCVPNTLYPAYLTELQKAARLYSQPNWIAEYFINTGPSDGGGHALIWYGLRLRTGQKIAVKTLNEKFFTNPKFQKYLKNEGQTLGQHASNHVMTIYDVISHQDHHYLVLEYLNPDQWQTLDVIWNQKRKADESFSADNVYQITQEMMATFQELLASDFIHRDWKPENLFLSKDPVTGRYHLKIGDFGVGTGVVDEDNPGTPAFSPPDLLVGAHRPRTEKDDLFSMAVIILTMTGETGYYLNNNGVEVIREAATILQYPHHLADRRRFPRLHEWMKKQNLNKTQTKAFLAFLTKALAPTAAERYQTAEAFWRDFEVAFSPDLTEMKWAWHQTKNKVRSIFQS